MLKKKRRKLSSPVIRGSATGPKLGRRERNKIERRQTIKTAARATFYEKGYFGATTREIAERAGIAEGTLFLYWKDKSDLLLSIVNDDLDAVARSALSKAVGSVSLLDQLIQVFLPRYTYWANQPKLFSAAVYETMLARSVGKQTPEMVRYDGRQLSLLEGVTSLVARQQRLGTIATDQKPYAVARMLMAIYLSEFRMWMVEDHLHVRKGIAHLKKSLEIAINGVAR